MRGVSVGYTKRRLNSRGEARFTACYVDLHGRSRSAGTFTTEKLAQRAWHKAENDQAEGRLGDPARGRQRFRAYVESTWLPNHQIELSTRQGYTYTIYKHIMPFFELIQMRGILPEVVQEWVTDRARAGVSAATIRHAFEILSAIFTTALNNRIIWLHPCKGVKTPTVPKKPLRIITPEQFDDIYDALPDGDSQLLTETDIETGMRWGELTELRPKDLNNRTREFTISRVVVELNQKFHPNGDRFLVKEYPKDKEPRRVKVTQQLVAKIEDHCRKYQLGPDDLLLAIREPTADTKEIDEPDPTTLGLTPPNSNGRQYRHGSMSGYSAGKCHCGHCRSAYARYRAERRQRGLDKPRGKRTIDTDGHIPRGWFRVQIWNKAVEAANIGFHVRSKDLRHAHASWLLAGGADLQVVKERLGHGSISTTENYLHTLPDADETALAALDKVRRRSSKNSTARSSSRPVA